MIKGPLLTELGRGGALFGVTKLPPLLGLEGWGAFCPLRGYKGCIPTGLYTGLALSKHYLFRNAFPTRFCRTSCSVGAISL